MSVINCTNDGAVLPPGTTGIEDADVVSDSDPLPF